jgi:predicted Zn finger-like uncharacterized protein
VIYRTTCPRCGSVFRLGEDQLKAADGWAQCGVCGENFDTHRSLLQEDGSPLAGPIPGTAASLTETPPPGKASISEPAPIAEPAAGKSDAQPDRLPSIILIDPDVPPPDDFGPLPTIRAANESLRVPPPHERLQVQQNEAPSAQVEYAAVPDVVPDVVPDAVADTVPDAVPDELSDEASFETYPSSRKRTWAWALASLVLLTVLAAQSAYFLRDPLVTHVPESRPALERLCALLDCSLSLPKNLALLQIVGSDLETESADRLTLTLTLGNRAPYAQAWPVLVLTLTDERNRPLARRSFAPSEYLGDARRIAAGMPARSEQALSLALAVRDVKPMGFDLQLVY